MIGEALRLIRVYHDMKARELADKLSISQSYLSEIENDKKKPSIDMIYKYAEVFNTKPHAILFFSEEYHSELQTIEGDTYKYKSLIRKKIIELLQYLETANKGNIDETVST